MATAAAITAAAIGAVGSIGGGLLSAKGAGAAAKAGRPQRQTVPIPPYAQAGQRLVARDYAANLNAVPPSFMDFINSGGTATFPMANVGPTPLEARQLGLVGPQGQQIPYLQPGQTSLTPQQLLYLGMQLNQLSPTQRKGPLAQLFRQGYQDALLKSLPQTPGRATKEGQIEKKEANTSRRLKARSAAGGLG